MKKRSPLFWLILIPIQIAAGFLFFRLGIMLDGWIFSNPTGQGHGVPFFSAICFLAASGMTVIVVIVSAVLAISGSIKKKAEEKEEKQYEK